MKTPLATSLSLVGVLLAGSAAALANTQILDGGEPASGASSAVLPDVAPVELTVPGSVPPTSETPNAADTASSTTVAPRTEPTASESLTTFNVGPAGAVTLDVIDGRLRLVEAVPDGGWTLGTSEEHAERNEVEVEFRSATTVVEFEAELVGDQIRPQVSSRSSVDAATSPATVPTDDDDGHEDEEDDHDDQDDDDHDDEERDDD